MDALTLCLKHAEDHCPDLKVLYTLWLADLTIEVQDMRTGETHGMTFPGATVAVTDWLDELQRRL